MIGDVEARVTKPLLVQSGCQRCLTRANSSPIPTTTTAAPGMPTGDRPSPDSEEVHDSGSEHNRREHLRQVHSQY